MKSRSISVWVLSGLGLLFASTSVFAAEGGTNGQIDAWFGVLNGYMASVLFFDVMPGAGEMPFIVGWLIIGAVFLTVRMGFINLKVMGHALQVIRGKYSQPG